MGSERRRGGRGGKNVPESSLIREFRITGLGARDNLGSNPASNSEAGRTRFRMGGHRGEDASESKTIHLADFATPSVDLLLAKRPKPARDYNPARCNGLTTGVLEPCGI